MTISPSNGVDEMLARIQLALEQAQSCIKGEMPEDITFGEAEDDTFGKIRGALDDVARIRASARPAVDGEVREALQSIIERFSGLAKRDLPRGGVKLTMSEKRTADARFVVDTCSMLLAAKPSSDPDTQNDKRMLEDMKLAHNVREAAIKECALEADSAASVEKEIFDAAERDAALSDTGRLAILDRALGRKTMAQSLALSLRALSSTGERKP